MLNRHCKKFLSFLARKEPNFDNGVFTYDWLENNYPESHNDIMRMIRFLESEGYITRTYLSESTIPLGITLEEKGKFYLQFYWEEIKYSFLKTIFLPVLVALLTYLVTRPI